MKNNKFLPVMLIMALMVTATGFSQAKITVKGSDTMVILGSEMGGTVYEE